MDSCGLDTLFIEKIWQAEIDIKRPELIKIWRIYQEFAQSKFDDELIITPYFCCGTDWADGERIYLEFALGIGMDAYMYSLIDPVDEDEADEESLKYEYWHISDLQCRIFFKPYRRLDHYYVHDIRIDAGDYGSVKEFFEMIEQSEQFKAVEKIKPVGMMVREMEVK